MQTESFVRVSEIGESQRRTAIFLGLLVVAVWAELVLKLRIDWSTNGQYEFGPFVPPFIAFLLYQRWKDRPTPRFSTNGWLVSLVAIGSLALLLPIRLIQEANPEWRPLNWIHALVVVTLTLIPALFYGGWRWVFHFAAPLILLFSALPWPLEIEQSVIQGMARAVAAATTECLNLADIPALQDGNVIQVPTGPVGIADACTGVRSLAGTLMASLFFGEFYRLSWLRRLTLLAIGVIIAFLLNLVRTFFLGWIAANQGIAAIEKWHDQTGFLIFCAAFAALWLVGEQLTRGQGHDEPQASTQTRIMQAVRWPVLISIAAWLVMVEVGTELWYQTRERNLTDSKTWTTSWPEQNPSFHFTEITDEARAILRFSEGRSAVLESPGLPRWQIFSFRWEPGRSSSQLAVLHRPDICLPAAGLRYISGANLVSAKLGQTNIPFESFVFDQAGRPLFVFRTLSEDRRPLGASSGFDQSVVGRLQSAWHGRRNLGQKLLQIGISGVDSPGLALADLESRLSTFVKVQP